MVWDMGKIRNKIDVHVNIDDQLPGPFWHGKLSVGIIPLFDKRHKAIPYDKITIIYAAYSLVLMK